jgi:hypothetical protein
MNKEASANTNVSRPGTIFGPTICRRRSCFLTLVISTWIFVGCRGADKTPAVKPAPDKAKVGDPHVTAPGKKPGRSAAKETQLATTLPATKPIPSSPPQMPLVGVANGRRVAVHAVNGMKLQRRGQWKLKEEIEALAWLEDGRLSAVTSGGRVFILRPPPAPTEANSRAEVRRPMSLNVPKRAAWRIREADEDAVKVRFPNGKKRLVVDPKGGLWLGHCSLQYEGDGDPCAAWRYHRLLPTAKESAKAPPIRRAPSAPKGTPAATLSFSLTKSRGASVLSCTHAGRRRNRRFSNRPCSRELAARWLSPASQYLLVGVESDCGVSEATTSYLLVHNCKLSSATKFDRIEQGPAFVWAHDAERHGQSGFVLRQRGQRLGWLEGELLRFSVR